MKYSGHVPTLSDRLKDVSPSATLALAQKARELKAEGHDVVSLTAGEPDTPTAKHILEAAKAALDRGETRYTAVAGIDPLREAIRAQYVADGLDYELNEVIVSSGAKQAVFNVVQCLLNPGDEAVLIAPYWLSYRDMVSFAGGTSRVVQTSAASGFVPSAKALEDAITQQTRVLILNSPSNPTGAAYSPADFASFAQVLRRHPHVTVVLDEIYRRFAYHDDAKASFLQADKDLMERSVVIDGASKTYALTGLRVGWALGPRNLISAMGRVQGQSTSNASSISQYAALAALTGDQSWVQEMVSTFDIRRRFVVGRLNAIPGVHCFEPKGAFYAFPDLSELVGRTLPDGTEIRDALTLTAHFLHEHKLVVVPGKPFGAPNHLRISYAASMDALSKGLDRMEEAIRAIN